MKFEKLKTELPKRNNNPHARDEVKKDKAADSAANEENGRDLFKGQHVRDVVDFSQFKFTRFVFNKHSLKINKFKMSKK